ncbi:phosphoheptose isomerase family protein [Staphylococcus capitis]|uniref:hypothetical protein n=1 Tax=Staphylococcus capitis TaxID=29388 RepID=UPI00164364E2|nr:hypothetical protein [Staphylococcus capitis]
MLGEKGEKIGGKVVVIRRERDWGMGEVGESIIELGGGSKEDIEGCKEGLGSLFEEA